MPWQDPPPEDLAREVWDELFPPEKRKPRPPPKTLYDNLPEGITEEDMPVAGLRKPDPLVFYKERPADETIPAATRLWRVSLNDLHHMGWLIERLMARSPHVPAHAWQGTLMTLMSSGYFFQRSERAVALARFVNEPWNPPFVEPLFILHQDLGSEGGSQRGSQGEKDCIALVRAMREWGKHQGAQELRRLNAFSDLPPSVFVNDLRGDKREEAWLQIR